MSALYNEIDLFAAQWLRNLVDAGRIAPGAVDARSITEIRADDNALDTPQVHLFAGIGGWSAALRMAGFADDFPIWTASCPCQPFSVAGRGLGEQDERHLWPDMLRLIRERRPARLAGEQVASSAGRTWFAALRADLEALGYAVCAVDLCAAGVGAPHIRQRLYWAAQRLGLADGERREGLGLVQGAAQGRGRSLEASRRGEARGLGDRLGARLEGHAGHGDGGGQSGRFAPLAAGSASEASRLGGLVDALSLRGGAQRRGPTEIDRAQLGASRPADRSDAHDGLWRDPDWLFCRDGKWRPVEPGSFPLADGIPGRVGRLRAYGNAIVPQVAAAFLTAVWGGAR